MMNPIPEFDTQRFWGKVRTAGDDDCWAWLGRSDRGGYGVLKINSRHFFAHRIAYTLLRGTIPDGLVIDHLCRNRGCQNPNHMEPVTTHENTRRGEVGKNAIGRPPRPLNSAGLPVCQNGHVVVGSNARPHGVYMACVQCCRDRAERFRARRRAA